MRLQATFQHPLADQYLRPGGPWDVPTLDVLSRGGGGTIVDAGTILDGSRVDADCAALASGLRRRGVVRGDVVAWQLPNWHEAVLLYRACWLVGAIAAPLQHRFGSADLDDVLEVLEPSLVLSAPDLALAGRPDAVMIRDDSDQFEAMLTEPPIEPAGVDGGDIAVAVLTSGSTGRSKVVLLSHRALAYKVMIQQSAHGLSSADVLLTPAPLSHVSGLLNGVLLSGAAGMKVVLMDAWDPAKALDLIEHEQVTYMGGPAVFLTSLIESVGFSASRVQSLRVCSIGGSSMTPAALARLADQLGCVVKRTYGMSEAPTITTAHDGDSLERGRETDGRAIGEAEIRVVDASKGTDLQPGLVGEIWVRGPEMFSGYALASQTAEAVAEGGWLRTGDLGVFDEQGWLRIAGRIKELIIRGGENIASAEVEGLLEAHPMVREAVAVGYPDAILGERVAAVVVADDGFDLDGCRQWFADSGVAKFKTPEAIIHVDAMPLSPTGKADRPALKEHAAKVMAQRLEDS